MIPVFQTRYAAETFGNCFEACVASILELPLAAVPDRAALVDADQWADMVARARVAGGEDAVLDLALPPGYDDGEQALRGWLCERGLAWVDVALGEPGGMSSRAWLELARDVLPEAYWIGHTAAVRDWRHATVWRGCQLEHDPHRGNEPDWRRIGKLVKATLLVAGNPALLARTLDPLPDVAGLLEAAAA